MREQDETTPPPLVPSASRAGRRGEDIASNWHRGRPHTIGFTKPTMDDRKTKTRSKNKKARQSRRANR